MSFIRENPYIRGMFSPGEFITFFWEAGRRFLKAARSHPAAVQALVPIRSLGPAHVQRIKDHLLALSPHDRYLRFGAIASDAQIARYVDGLDFERDEIFGLYSRRLELVGMAHLAFSVDQQCRSRAEFGVSVLQTVRGRGYGARLFDRASLHARNEGVHLMFIHALSENTAMLKIARQAGATVEREGSESECHLRLPPADIDSRITELMDEQIAQTDYRLKVQALQWQDVLEVMQDVRQGVRNARQHARP